MSFLIQTTLIALQDIVQAAGSPCCVYSAYPCSHPHHQQGKLLRSSGALSLNATPISRRHGAKYAEPKRQRTRRGHQRDEQQKITIKNLTRFVYLVLCVGYSNLRTSPSPTLFFCWYFCIASLKDKNTNTCRVSSSNSSTSSASRVRTVCI